MPVLAQIDTCYVIKYDYNICQAELLFTFERYWENSSLLDSLVNYSSGWIQYDLDLWSDSLNIINPKRIQEFHVFYLDTLFDTTGAIVSIDTVPESNIHFQAGFFVRDSADCTTRLKIPNILDIIN